MSNQATRDGFGLGLKEVAASDRNVVALDCDLGRSTRSFAISEVDPSRFVEMGIAEQDMISTAAGMALMGKTVFVNSFAVFITGRCFDQIRQQVSLPSANIKICGSSAGLTQGPDGATHQSVIDAAMMRLLPNMTVLSPADPEQARQAVWASYRIKGPVYLRLSRFTTGNFLPENATFNTGKIQTVRKGKDVALVATGPILKNVLDAAEALKARGVRCAIYNAHTLKPFDVEAARAIAHEFQTVFTIEEHSVFGGLGSCFADAMPAASADCRVRRIGVNDTFGESGTAEDLLKKHRLDPASLVQAVLQFCSDTAFAAR